MEFMFSDLLEAITEHDDWNGVMPLSEPLVTSMLVCLDSAE